VRIVSAACGGWTGDYLVGDAAPAMAARARRSGFAFAPYGWADFPDWGVSVSTPDWVRAAVAAVGGLEEVQHVPHGWTEHQDVWTFRRTVIGGAT
jgi:hypothetical protein